MKAMILAAGRGERMRPLTDSCPKPLLKVGASTLIEHHISALQKANIRELVINTGWLGEQLSAYLGDGNQFGVDIQYAHEGYPALETAGGIKNALSLLGEDEFIVVNGDVFTDYNFKQLKLEKDFDAHIVLVANPKHNPSGDFSLSGQHIVQAVPGQAFTYSGIAMYRRRFFARLANGRSALKPLFDQAIGQQILSGETFNGEWTDIGTVERLNSLNRRLAG